MKRIISVSVCLMILFSLIGCSSNVVANANQSSNKDLLITEKTTQYFSDDSVPEEDIIKIVNAGMNATSAVNKQDWYFSVVTNKELLDEFKTKINFGGNRAQFGSGTLEIVVSCGDKGEFDAGLATQNMVDYAILSGYGTKIVSSPCKIIDENYKERLGIPSNMHSVAVIIIGKVKDGVDGISSASTRKSFDDVVTMIK